MTPSQPAFAQPVVAGFSGSLPSLRAVQTAYDLAQQRSATLYVVHVSPIVPMVWLTAEAPASLAYLAGKAEDEAKAYRARIVSSFGPEQQSGWEYRHRRGVVSHELAGVAKEVLASTIFVGKPRRGLKAMRLSVPQQLGRIRVAEIEIAVAPFD